MTTDDNNEVETVNIRNSTFYRVVEHLYQNTLPMHGNRLERYDTKIIQAKMRSRVKAEGAVKQLEEEASAGRLSHLLRYCRIQDRKLC